MQDSVTSKPGTVARIKLTSVPVTTRKFVLSPYNSFHMIASTLCSGGLYCIDLSL